MTACRQTTAIGLWLEGGRGGTDSDDDGQYGRKPLLNSRQARKKKTKYHITSHHIASCNTVVWLVYDTFWRAPATASFFWTPRSRAHAHGHWWPVVESHRNETHAWKQHRLVRRQKRRDVRCPSLPPVTRQGTEPYLASHDGLRNVSCVFSFKSAACCFCPSICAVQIFVQRRDASNISSYRSNRSVDSNQC